MSRFTDSIDHYLEGFRTIAPSASPGCPECLDTPEDGEWGDGSKEWNDWSALANEGSFSWSQCDSCGSRLDGQRHPAHGLLPGTGTEDDPSGGEWIHLEICTDCLMFHANGEEPEEWSRR